MGVEGAAGVEQRLRLGEGLRGRADDALRGALLADGAVGQRPAERVARPGVARAALVVAVAGAGHADILPRCIREVGVPDEDEG